MRALASVVRHFSVIAYLLVACAATWALLLPLGRPWGLPPAWHALGAAGPLVAAYLVVRLRGGRAGVRAWLRGWARWRVGARWWLLAAAGPLVLFGASAAAVRLAGGGWPDFARLGDARHGTGWLLDLLLVASLAYGVGGEAGWRGFMLPRLQARYGPLRATLVLAPAWALWHWPAFLYRPELQGGYAAQAGFAFTLLASAFVLTFLYDGTRGSLLLTALWYTLNGAALRIAAETSPPVGATMHALLGAVAVAIGARWILREGRPAVRLTRPRRLRLPHRRRAWRRSVPS